MQPTMVYGKVFPNGFKTLAKGTHITKDGAKSLCGRLVAAVQPGTADRCADCQVCRKKAGL